MAEAQPSLKKNPNLKDFQEYISEVEQARGLQTDISHYTLMMGEEVGELFKAIRKTEGHQIDPQSTVGPVAEELVDVFIFVCAIANNYDIDLEEAFNRKEQINAERTWKKSGDNE